MGKGFDVFMANPYWKRIYENAPSDNLREYYQLMFDHRSFIDDSLDEAAMERLRELWLTREDLRYLMDHTNMNPARIHYSRCIKAIDDSPDDCCVAAISCIGEIRNPWHTSPEQEDA